MNNFISNLFNFNLLKPLNLRLILQDLFKFNTKIYSSEFHLQKGISWLINAQKITKDGGFSFGYSLISGWAPSYPETSGYIIPTLLDYYLISKNDFFKSICKKVADWECLIQLKNGGFQSGIIGENKQPSIFNTGQIILGLIRAYKELGDEQYYNSAIKAGNFLVKNQENNGNWIKYCYKMGSHTYNVRTAWSLLELYKITDKIKFKESAINNLQWALTQRKENYWFRNNDPNLKLKPLLHFIAYTIRGLLESGLILENELYIQTAYESAIRLLNSFKENGKLHARFNSKWESDDYFSCLTGDAQISIVWFKLYEIYQDNQFLINAVKLNNYLKLKQVISKRFKSIDGAIKGSDPIWGNYMRYTFLNWATKFYCDALIIERKILQNKF